VKWTVLSRRLAWPAGSVLAARDLAGCNIDALVKGGHLAPSTQQATPDEPKITGKRTPVEPADEETAEKPEEQE
jgi:hypothetical protein